MKNLSLIILIICAFEKNVFSQKNSGTYSGIFGNSKIIGTIKATNSALIGSFYESRKKKHNLIGAVENNKIEGSLTLEGLGNFTFEGIFKEDSLQIYFFLTPNSKISEIRLKKVSSRTTIDLDKYFEKEENDLRLYGDWDLLSKYDILKKELRKKDYQGVTFYSDGSYAYKSLSSQINFKDIVSFRWYTSDAQFYSLISTIKFTSEYNWGNYQISGDSLTIHGARYILKYLRKK
jgi:hypothetical protein